MQFYCAMVREQGLSKFYFLGFPLWAHVKSVLTNALQAVKEKVYFHFIEYKLDIYPLSQVHETHYSCPLHPNSFFTYLICQRQRRCGELPATLAFLSFPFWLPNRIGSYIPELPMLAMQNAPNAYVFVCVCEASLYLQTTVLSVLLSASLARMFTWFDIYITSSASFLFALAQQTLPTLL